MVECWKHSSDQLVAIGMNCLHPAFVTPLLKTVKDLDIPWIVYPNSGENWQCGIGLVTMAITWFFLV